MNETLVVPALPGPPSGRQPSALSRPAASHQPARPAATRPGGFGVGRRALGAATFALLVLSVGVATDMTSQRAAHRQDLPGQQPGSGQITELPADSAAPPVLPEVVEPAPSPAPVRSRPAPRSEPSETEGAEARERSAKEREAARVAERLERAMPPGFPFNR